MSSSGSEYEAETLESDSSNEPEKKPKTKTRRKTAGDEKECTSRNYICSACGKGFSTRNRVYNHLRTCEPNLEKKNNVTCHWCKLTFHNRGALSNHAFLLHGDTRYRAFYRPIKEEKKHECRICKQAFSTKLKLKFHIRLIHFNLKGRVPYAELKNVNQVWFEKVKNSNNIIEIRKMSNNLLVMKKIDENTAIKVNSDNERIIDVSDLYPTTQKCNIKVKCKYCNNLYTKRRYKTHVEEIHFQVKKQHCTNCNRYFNRFYEFLKHVCSKTRLSQRGVRKGKTDILITNVSSLSNGPKNVVKD